MKRCANYTHKNIYLIITLACFSFQVTARLQLTVQFFVGVCLTLTRPMKLKIAKYQRHFQIGRGTQSF
jgi:hypothetical protein